MDCMFQFICKYNFCYLIIFFLLLICVVYYITKKLKDDKIAFHSFSKEETEPLRGLLACLIILTHVSYQFSRTELSWIFTYFGAPAVSIFFFMSGFGLTVSTLTKGMKYVHTFLGKSMKKLLPPLLITSFIWIAISCIFLHGDIGSELLGFITFNPPLAYSWFVYALILFYISFFIVYRFIKNNNLLRISILLLITACICTVFRVLNFEVYWYISLFAFNVGNIYATFQTQFNSLLKKYTIFTILTTLSLLVVLDCLQTITTMLALIPMGAVVIILVLGSGKNSRFMSFLGKISYEIYLMHGIVVPVLKAFDLNWISYLVIAESTSILTAYFLHLFCDRFITPCLIKSHSIPNN